MLGILLTILIVISLLFGIAGDSAALSDAVLNSCNDAVQLCLYLSGSMALWGGIMKIAEKCEITKAVTSIINRPLKLLFRGLSDRHAMDLISLNVTANLLGLGNAATPLGISAMKQLHKSDPEGVGKHTAMFILLNTASIQLIPMTVSSMRLSHGASDPWDCTLPTVLTSVCAAAVGCIAVVLIHGKRRGVIKNESADTYHNCSCIDNCGNQKG